MRKPILFILTLSSLFIFNHAEAIGGRGGGARGGGARGSAPGGRIQGARPQQYASIPSMSMSRDIGARQPLSASRQEFNRTSLNQNLRNNNLQTASQVSQQFRQNHPNANNALNNRLNARYYGAYDNLWRNAGWAATAGWMGLNSDVYGYPAYYYDAYGTPTYLSPQETVIYSPTNVTVTPQTPVSTQPIISEPGSDWLPLGVYALSSSADAAADSNMILQLSLNKQGFLSGTYYNAATDQSYPMEGKVNKDTQEAIWKLSDNAESPVAWTGLYNLTQDATDVNIHFPDGTDQTKVLVRLKN